mmetsp:Transcript_36258/g.95597  ORF Transcript_36258/g.95597 Transcript_36258/m.95597 type:complete len:147 (+) Transcript_36258:1849-2289(+)
MRPRLWPAEVIRAFDMVRADHDSRFRVLTGSSATFATSRSEAQLWRSQFGVQNGAPSQHAGAELSARHEGLCDNWPSQQPGGFAAVQGEIAASPSAAGPLSKLHWPACSRTTACRRVRSERRSLHSVRCACSQLDPIYIGVSVSAV